MSKNIPELMSMPAAAGVLVDRRSGVDRRRLSLRTFFQGGFTPRRRRGRRRSDTLALVDWHEPHLFFLAIAILLLSVADAFLTLTLLTRGAEEANPILDYVLEAHPELFAGAKMALTGSGLLVLVALARAKVFRVVRVSSIIHWFLLGYAGLIGYEWWLLRSLA
ncbi:MAG TPA: DUF5658 family protein [Gammaproteobacteria bacterium]|nr:DUF5658 family protein [Gammaproteobacteria bacterium]